MRKTYLVVGLGALVAVAIAVPALGGPTATDSSAKKTAKKALKAARSAAAAAADAQGDADIAKGSARQALSALGGNRIVEINTRAASVPAGTPILQLNGFTLEATCNAPSENLAADTTVPDGEITSISRQVAGTDQDVQADNMNPGNPTDLTNGISSSDRIYSINYSGGDGRNVMVQVATEDNIGGNTCLYTGFAIG
jgi:hypothetical protein